MPSQRKVEIADRAYGAYGDSRTEAELNRSFSILRLACHAEASSASDLMGISAMSLK
jgi:hypothetical protein